MLSPSLQPVLHVVFLLSGLFAGLMTLVLLASSYSSKLSLQIRIGMWVLSIGCFASSLICLYPLLYPKINPLGDFGEVHLIGCSLIYLVLGLANAGTWISHLKRSSCEAEGPFSQLWKELAITAAGRTKSYGGSRSHATSAR